MSITVFRAPTAAEIPAVSAQIAISYKAAYRDHMRQDYLDSLSPQHWVPILEESLSRGDSCLIAEESGRILGSAVYGPSENDPHAADWYSIYLLPGEIGRGLGHRLYAAMEQQMRAQGFRSATLEVLTDNQRAILFYQQHGYQMIDSFSVEENGMVLSCHRMRKTFD